MVAMMKILIKIMNHGDDAIIVGKRTTMITPFVLLIFLNILRAIEAAQSEKVFLRVRDEAH
jgi:hypothetical protein